VEGTRQQHHSRELDLYAVCGGHYDGDAASQFECDIFVEKDGERVNGKSIMGLMMLAAGLGSKLTVICEGSDADKAISEIEALINRKFDET